jgi:hypothetical protein
LKSYTQPADTLKGKCLFSVFHVEKPTVLLLFTKTNKCKELKNEILQPQRPLHTQRLNITSLGTESWLPTLKANMLPTELSLTTQMHLLL